MGHPLSTVRFDLEPLPDDLLLLILSYLPPRELAAPCRAVSRRWKRLVDSPFLWRLKCERECRADVLEASRTCTSFPWPRVCLKKPFTRNLLRNPFGAEGLRHWEVTHGGDGWTVEDNRSPLDGAESQKCFVTSYFWCVKTQLVDLLESGLWGHYLDVHQPPICISDWYGSRADCGCVYQMKVELLAADRQTAIKVFESNPEPIPQWNDQSYAQVSYVFQNYGPGVRFVRFSHRGKDTQFWKGWYGARITNSSVTVRIATNLAENRESGTGELPSGEPAATRTR
ncbi:F-box only protein 27 isoform X1 [Spea bombifrons]|uniref:F-box only protein 27 isoform X1 n=1 Tax=Spea bombifrons TaxID=233779 RepID=UPI00234BD9C1|nr:F-box only protein 27 isoform X1 [Spea bombifrons]